MTSFPPNNHAYLVKYDSTQGKFTDPVTSAKSDPALGEDDTLVVGGQWGYSHRTVDLLKQIVG